MMVYRLFLALFFCLFSFAVFAQDYLDLARFHYSNTPPTSFDSLDRSTKVAEFGADFTIPIVLDSNNTFLTGLSVEKIRTDFNYPLSPRSIATVNLKLGFNRKFNSKWSGTFMLLPKLASDFESHSSKNFQLGALALMKYSKKENIKYNIGIYYNGERFGPFIVPLFGLYYKSENGNFEANLTLPIWADVNYKLNKFMKLGANFAAFVRSYHLSDGAKYVVKKSNDIFGYLQFNLTKSVLLQTKAGYTIGRSFKVYKDDDTADFGFSAFRFGDDRTVLNPTFKDGIVFKVRLIYRFHIEK